MADIAKFIEEVKSMSVLELNELVKALETEFGVSAAAPMAVAGGAAPAAAAEAAEEEKSEFWAKENKEFKRWQEIERMMSEEKIPSNIFLFNKIRGKLKEYMELSEQDEYHLTMDILDLIDDEEE